MKNLILFMVLASLVILSSRSFAELPPPPLKNAKVNAIITFDVKRGVYSYAYEVYNPPVNISEIFSFDIDVTSKEGDAELSREGLVNTACYMPYGSEYAFQHKKMIPVGMDGPPGYMSAEYVGEDGVNVREWSCSLSDSGYAGWGSSEESMIKPGQSIGGFLLTSYGLPGIRNTIIKPDYVIDMADIPEEVFEENRLYGYLDSVYSSIAYHGKTLGPTAPPADFKAVAFIDYIISLKHEAATLGWIKNEGIVNSLDVKLENAKKAIEKNNIRPAKNMLEAFINEVEAQGCATYDKCPEGKHITPEGYGLLKYNAEYLLGKL